MPFYTISFLNKNKFVTFLLLMRVSGYEPQQQFRIRLQDTTITAAGLLCDMAMCIVKNSLQTNISIFFKQSKIYWNSHTELKKKLIL